MRTKLNRRTYLKANAALAAGVWSSTTPGTSRAANEQLNIAIIGAGKGGVGGVLNLPRVSGDTYLFDWGNEPC